MLKVINISKNYSDISILKNIYFQIPEKSIVSLTGKNGIGKTTLLNIIAGISDFEGDILLNDYSIKYNLKDYIDLTVLIPVNPFLYDFLTLSEMIDLVISILGQTNYLINYKKQMVEMLELEEFKDILVKNLSLGSKQKLAFILSFINDPKLILIDEPFVNFDEKSLMRILKFIEEYTIENNSIIIFSTHSKDEIINKLTTHNININGIEDIKVTRRVDI